MGWLLKHENNVHEPEKIDIDFGKKKKNYKIPFVCEDKKHRLVEKTSFYDVWQRVYLFMFCHKNGDLICWCNNGWVDINIFIDFIHLGQKRWQKVNLLFG